MKIQKLIEAEHKESPVTTSHRFQYEVGGVSYPVVTRQSRTRSGLWVASYTILVQDAPGPEWVEETCNYIQNDFGKQQRDEQSNQMIYVEIKPSEANRELTRQLYAAFRRHPEMSSPNWHFKIVGALDQISMQYSPVEKNAPRGMGHEGPAA